ncbi:MAG: hypothetical protein CFE24_00755 [Flavobacterium sp. BFFFF2]|nr:MAG: hypothetical protein CFE24_00755 [Flavobacterium sp. BFFFF2]
MLMTLMGTASVSWAQKPAVMLNDQSGWHKIGKSTIDFTKDKEEIDVYMADRFAKIKFKVTKAPVDLIRLEMYFESGDKQDIDINETILAPGESKVIALNGGERNLKKIIFVCKTKPNYKDKKAHVEVWGLKTNANKK